MIDIIVIAPLLLSAIASLLLKDRQGAVKYIAFIASMATLLIVLYLFTTVPGIQSFTWFTLGTLAFNISVSTLPINMMLLLLVSTITPLIFLYSMGFMSVPSEQTRFYFEMSVFAASMLLFAISANFITMFIAWEMLGITSYLLIGFWYKKELAPAAARKAITIILLGDIAMLIGILMIGASYNSFEFNVVLAAAPSHYLSIALVLILIGAFTKSAQFPFHEWLPDAMEGPTPVSAFLHSSTMVKAGVFLITILLVLYSKAGLLDVILIIGIISAVLGLTNALTERHIKKVLAYSTIEDLGLMFIALGLNAYVAAMMLFFVQTFYKALLFLNAGSIMRANDEKEDIFKIYGVTMNRSIYITLLIGVLSIAAIFPLSGFFGKALVEASASQNLLVYVILLAIELGTSLYIFRWLFTLMRKTYESSGSLKINYNSIPKTMIIPVYMLAFLVIIASVAYLFLPSYIASGVVAFNQITPLEVIIATMVSVAGIALAYRVYRQGHRMNLGSTNKMLFSALHNSDITNRFYLLVTNAVSSISNSAGYNDLVFDRITYGAAQKTVASGNTVNKMVNGQLNLYVLAFVLGLIVLLLVFTI
jgi:NADH-quinone oxidoreductase subunit L